MNFFGNSDKKVFYVTLAGSYFVEKIVASTIFSSFDVENMAWYLGSVY